MKRIWMMAAGLVGILETSMAADGPATTSAPVAAAPLPTAVFAFEERGSGVRDYGQKIADILFANLVADPNLFLVDRQDMKKLLEEQELNVSGMVSPDQAVKIGKLTGAKVLITGSVIDADKTMYLVAKLISTETSRVFGESVKGRTSDELAPLVERLAAQTAASLAKNAPNLVAPVVKLEDRLAAVKKAVGEGPKPTVMVRVAERHVGQATIDPAAETEMTLFCKEAGFEALDPKASDKKADILIEGEGFSEFGMRRGNLVSVKARVEIKAIDRATDKLLAADRETAVVVDMTEQIAGKTALQEATARIAERMLPKLVKQADAKR